MLNKCQLSLRLWLLVPLEKQKGWAILCAVLPSSSPTSHRRDPKRDLGYPGHSCNPHLSSPQWTKPSAEPQAFGDGLHQHPLPSHCPHVQTARSRLRLRGATKAQTRPPARGHSPRFCPRSTAYGRLRSGGSTGVGASACPSRRLHSPTQSHCHTERNIFPDSRWKASHFRRKPRPVSSRVPLSIVSGERRCQGNCTSPASVQPSVRFLGDPRSSRTNVSTRPSFQGIAVPSRQCPLPTQFRPDQRSPFLWVPGWPPCIEVP